MRYLLDTNTCSAHMRRPGSLAHRLLQQAAYIAVPTIVLAELYAGAYQRPNSARLLNQIRELVDEFALLDFDARCAAEFGNVKAVLRPKRINIPPLDLAIASVALAHDLTLVTHNTADFQAIPGLRLEDWLAP